MYRNAGCAHSSLNPLPNYPPSIHPATALLVPTGLPKMIPPTKTDMLGVSRPDCVTESNAPVRLVAGRAGKMREQLGELEEQLLSRQVLPPDKR